MNCKICNKIFKTWVGIGVHIKKTHKISSQQYYDRYFRNYSRDEGFCLECGKETRFQNLHDGSCYNIFCSSKCIQKSIKTKEKRKITNIKKFGLPYSLQSKKVRIKIKETNLKRYGVENPYQSKEIQKKIKETNLDRYGVDYPIQSISIKEKIKETNLKRYGVENPAQNKEVKEKIKETLLNKNLVASKNGLPLFKFYAPKNAWIDKVRRSPKDNDILEVRCKKCNEWFVPKISDLNNRIQSINGNRGFGEHNLYCSDDCKNSCSIYNKTNYAEGTNPNVDRPYQKEWSQEVLKRAKYTCEICGSKNYLVAHHIEPVKLRPDLQADIDNGICLCNNCHYKHGHQDECLMGNLARMIC